MADEHDASDEYSSDGEVSDNIPVVSSKVDDGKKDKAKKKPAVAATTAAKEHPSTAVMVRETLEKLRSRREISLAEIKKNVYLDYPVDPEKYGRLITRAVKKALDTGDLIQGKGHGASGSFKLPPKTKSEATGSKKETTKAAPKVKKAENASSTKVAKPTAKPAAKPAAKPTAATKKDASTSGASKAEGTKSRPGKQGAGKAVGATGSAKTGEKTEAKGTSSKGGAKAKAGDVKATSNPKPKITRKGTASRKDADQEDS